MNQLAQIIKEYVAQAHVNYNNARERIEAKAATANNDLRPTIDKYGRMHAPCDGYYWEGDTYAGGSYLPIPLEFWEWLEELTGKPQGPRKNGTKTYGQTHRIKVTTEEAKDIEIACESYASVKIGRVWDDGVSCYVYIQTTRDKLSALVADYKAEQEAILSAERAAELAAKRALKGEAPEGRVVVVGKIVSFKRVERQAYYYRDPGVDYKMLVELENRSTVWGSQVDSLHSAEVGDTIRFTATFERAKDDNTHAFFKRPAKAEILFHA